MSVKHVVAGAVLAMMAYSPGTFATEQATALAIIDDTIPTPLTTMAGNVENGKKTFINRKLGNCLACHEVTALKDQPFHGKVGPSLDGVAERYSEPELRLILVNSKKVFEGTIMPAFYSQENLARVGKKFQGKTILDAQQVEDVIAYLKTLQE